ncbi:unnamed protein product [Vitrella brassicaformis CCMP3155]|uniref:Uncharacterized protein n=1 Tax=Vitrella brassicaformis (strain CCMP3155) TaxID=1169540 RepID=A0A0G4EDT7_VITBC|nr:unnamed protein product [Vitrella brassicaformis CCMP3155]|eukprot:CEL93698.1 unnamed protein product [Vitrella brassicaformis CCMP3155]
MTSDLWWEDEVETFLTHSSAPLWQEDVKASAGWSWSVAEPLCSRKVAEPLCSRNHTPHGAWLLSEESLSSSCPVDQGEAPAQPEGRSGAQGFTPSYDLLYPCSVCGCGPACGPSTTPQETQDGKESLLFSGRPADWKPARDSSRDEPGLGLPQEDTGWALRAKLAGIDQQLRVLQEQTSFDREERSQMRTLLDSITQQLLSIMPQMLSRLEETSVGQASCPTCPARPSPARTGRERQQRFLDRPSPFPPRRVQVQGRLPVFNAAGLMEEERRLSDIGYVGKARSVATQTGGGDQLSSASGSPRVGSISQVWSATSSSPVTLSPDMATPSFAPPPQTPHKHHNMTFPQRHVYQLSLAMGLQQARAQHRGCPPSAFPPPTPPSTPEFSREVFDFSQPVMQLIGSDKRRYKGKEGVGQIVRRSGGNRLWRGRHRDVDSTRTATPISDDEGQWG